MAEKDDNNPKEKESSCCEDINDNDELNVSEEYDVLNSKLDDIIAALDIIEKTNDDIYQRLKLLLQSNRDIREQFRVERISQMKI